MTWGEVVKEVVLDKEEDSQQLEEEKKDALNRYGEILLHMQDKTIVSVVFAARDHEKLANYLFSDWGDNIGEEGSESAGEMAIRLLRQLKKIRDIQLKRRPVGGGPY